MFWRVFSRVTLRVSKSLSLNSCVIVVLHGRIWRSLSLLDPFRHSYQTISGSLHVKMTNASKIAGWISFLTENIEFDTQTWMIFLSGTGPYGPNLNRTPNARRVTITESSLWMNSFRTNARCSPSHVIASTKNSTLPLSIDYPYPFHLCITTHKASYLNTGGIFFKVCMSSMFTTPKNIFTRFWSI